MDERKPTYEELTQELEKKEKITLFIGAMLFLGMAILGAAIMAYCGCNLFYWFGGMSLVILSIMGFVVVVATELKNEIQRCK